MNDYVISPGISRSVYTLLALFLSIATHGAELTLSWVDNSNNEAGFKVERSLDGVVFSQIATVDANTEMLTDQELQAETPYWYRVRAYNSAGNSAYTNIANGTTGTESSSELSVALTSPESGSVFDVGDAVEVAVIVNDPTIFDRLELLVDGSVVGEDTLAPFGLLWAGATVGVHSVQVRGVGLDGGSALSELIAVSVEDSSQSIDPPAQGAYRGNFVLPVVGSDEGGEPRADDAETGRFSIWVDSDGSIQFIGAETSTGAMFSVRNVSMAGDGSFIVVGTGTGENLIIRGHISSKGIEGIVDGTEVMLSGGMVDPEGPSSPASGFYEAYGVRTTDTSVMVIVGGDGLGFVSVSKEGVLQTAEVPVEISGNEATISSSELNTELNLDLGLGTAEGLITVAGKSDITIMGIRSDVAALRRLENISTRGVIGSGNGVMITGFVVSGTEAKDVLIRAIGPGLTTFGIQEPSSDPVLELMSDSGAIATNNRWIVGNVGSAIETVSAQVGAFPLDPSSQDAVLLVTVAPGRYSAVVNDASGQGGDTLIEIYDASEIGTDGNDLSNLSTRGYVTAVNNLIGGFVVTGNLPKRVLVRGVGPGLADFGIGDALPEVRLLLTQRVDGEDVRIGEFENWGTQPNAEAIAEAAFDAGAFDLDPGSSDSAILLWLEPGVYTAVIQPGNNQLSGTALIEVYQSD